MEDPNKKWRCRNCAYIYSEAIGDEKHGIPPGTRWEDIPEDWVCPVCGALKRDFKRWA